MPGYEWLGGRGGNAPRLRLLAPAGHLREEVGVGLAPPHAMAGRRVGRAAREVHSTRAHQPVPAAAAAGLRTPQLCRQMLQNVPAARLHRPEMIIWSSLPLHRALHPVGAVAAVPLVAAYLPTTPMCEPPLRRH